MYLVIAALGGAAGTSPRARLAGGAVRAVRRERGRRRAFANRAAVTVPAEKLPEPSRWTTALAVFVEENVGLLETLAHATLPADPLALPVTLPVRLAVMVPAAKLPDASRWTTALAVFVEANVGLPEMFAQGRVPVEIVPSV